MEERGSVGGGKDKKYVLYTVVGDEKLKTTTGVWVIRVVLGTLLVVALSIVPYVSLRMAQVNDRTLVVFQPVLIHNSSRISHTTARSSTASKSVHNTKILQSDSLKKDKHNVTEKPEVVTSRHFGNGTIITLHESAVTLAISEDSNDTKELPAVNTTDKVDEDSTNATTVSVSIAKIQETKEPFLTTIIEVKTAIPPISTSSLNKLKTEENDDTLSISMTTPETKSSDINLETESEHVFTTPEIIPELRKPILLNKKRYSEIKSTSKPKITGRHIISHKLAYVAVASSGNHVGGVCIWKTNNNITNWSYFYENIPIEYQSTDVTDRDLRGMLVAIRTWYSKWEDYHVVLKSQTQALKTSKHPMVQAVQAELEEKSEDHFTYEMEWRFRKDDGLMSQAYSLARLYKNFDHWAHEFRQNMEIFIGQKINKKVSKRRIPIAQEVFATNQEETETKIGSFDSLAAKEV